MSKLTTVEIQEALAKARKAVPTSSTWKHYKGGVYQITGHVLNTATAAIDVLYKRVDGPGFNLLNEEGIECAWPATEWDDTVSEQIGDGSVPDDIVWRFVEVRKVEIWQPKERTRNER